MKICRESTVAPRVSKSKLLAPDKPRKPMNRKRQAWLRGEEVRQEMKPERKAAASSCRALWTMMTTWVTVSLKGGLKAKSDMM